VSHLRQRLEAARLYLVCAAREDAFVEAALRGGVDLLQLRIKAGRDDEILAVARRYARLCARHGALFILNDRPDLVAAAGADGVHVGQDDMTVAQARELVGAERLIGLSTHTPEQVDDAAGVDYIGVGPVHATPTKPGRPAVGVELLSYAAAHAGIPWFAIGGIDAGNLPKVIAAGATRVAVVRALTEAADPTQAAAALNAPQLGPPVGQREVGVGTT
jgi:thiamine-phosphate pyrophosphorylase